MDAATRPPYRGRFAPSPTGPLHFGSLIAAVGSYLHARSAGGTWLVRIEDLDPPRVAPGASDTILRTLEAYGLQWDGPVTYQSRSTVRYEEALEKLAAAGHTYACTCSRREISKTARRGAGGPIYPGTCRGAARQPASDAAQRLRTAGTTIRFGDPLFGPIDCDLETEIGDFVLRRADGLFAYQLAVVVDDAAQGINDVVRGADLLEVTPGQIHLFRLLEWPSPSYLHLPLAVDGDGDKLSKQRGAAGLPDDDPRPPLLRALRFLGQRPPAELRASSLAALWDWATAHWDPARIPRRRSIAVVPEEPLP